MCVPTCFLRGAMGTIGALIFKKQFTDYIARIYMHSLLYSARGDLRA